LICSDQLEEGDLVVVLNTVDCILVNLMAGQICLVAEIYQPECDRQTVIVDGVLIFDLRIITSGGKEVDVWYHEIRKLE
jgi:hypothetical protein